MEKFERAASPDCRCPIQQLRDSLLLGTDGQDLLAMLVVNEDSTHPTTWKNKGEKENNTNDDSNYTGG